MNPSKKNEIEARVDHFLIEQGFTVQGRDFEKPWGGYFVIPDNETEKFITVFFGAHATLFEHNLEKLSPKILVVAPGHRLSWQYHDRRAEYHKVIEGPVAYPLSKTDTQPEQIIYQSGDLIEIPQGTRHRLVGLKTWGVVAEIWRHTDPNNPSNEADNHRVQDDYGR
ncbi:MAG TPA: phosphoheptose isomerase [Candidatus Andersenbacteria bacterium]|nr:phosphoheptose isomerase [Candidatus Andersenbacteria bacterium]